MKMTKKRMIEERILGTLPGISWGISFALFKAYDFCLSSTTNLLRWCSSRLGHKYSRIPILYIDKNWITIVVSQYANCIDEVIL